MQRYVAFLRAINVGGRTVKMDVLRGRLEALGYANVESFIASGNLIFEAGRKTPEALEAEIERELRTALGYEVATFLRTTAELAAVAAFDPFPSGGPFHSSSVGFLREAPGTEAEARVLAARSEVDDLRVHGRELWWLARTRSQESKISGATLEKALGQPMTLRNVTTVRKLAAKYPPKEG